MREQTTSQEDYRVFTYWSNGFYYKFRGEAFALHSQEIGRRNK